MDIFKINFLRNLIYKLWLKLKLKLSHFYGNSYKMPSELPIQYVFNS